ncbi:chemotaxis protein CheX [Fodinibius halophilus]|uniref:Chemotaxis protein CheX n=1 Tax=Fodinibius halophilus TaxID=1736908 RepID=A0A6M1SU03_9BACT|nr:chemotaxis protein CheX [Fodinibius halophilus]NGP87418.1 chemotaxis protein CheX [Fodinibius halophilus]
MSENYKNKIHDIAVNTFEVTCYMFPLEEWEMEDDPITEVPKDGIQSVVGFNGAAEGEMVITPTQELLTAIAANMLGEDSPSDEQKSGALGEIANIICGNLVPIFASNDKICYLDPPKIIEGGFDDAGSPKLHEETVLVYLDEGTAEITVHYSKEGEDD